MVAMIDVPPEQVPEGILNLARSHRPWILHVRIVIADDDDDNENEEKEDDDDHRHHRHHHNEKDDNDDDISSSSSSSSSSRTYLVLFQMTTQLSLIHISEPTRRS